jgi:hypothetical protein
MVRYASRGTAMTGRDEAAGGPVAGVDPARLTGTSAAAGPIATGPGKAGPSRWDVETLCGPAGEAILVHKGEHYRLRVTARGRLILTK